MSYCRWSSNNFGCDVYVYANVNGNWTTHVAYRRHKDLDAPKVDTSTPERWAETHNAQMEYLRHANAAMEKISLPHAGKSFDDATPSECAQRLKMLAWLGYRVPPSAIKALLEEAPELGVAAATVDGQTASNPK